MRQCLLAQYIYMYYVCTQNYTYVYDYGYVYLTYLNSINQGLFVRRPSLIESDGSPPT